MLQAAKSPVRARVAFEIPPDFEYANASTRLSGVTLRSLLLFTLVGVLLVRASLEDVLQLTRSDPDGVGAGVLFNIVMLAIGAVAAWLLVRKKRQILLVFLLYAAWCAVSLSYAPDPLYGARLLFANLTIPCVFAAALLVTRSTADVRTIVGAVLVSSAVPLAVGLIEAVQGAGAERVSSTFPHANVFAFYLVFVSFALLWFHHTDPRKGPIRWWVAPHAGLVLILLVLTGTRSAWVAALVGVGVYAWFVNRRAIILFLLLPLLLLAPPVAARLDSLGSRDATVLQIKAGAASLDSYAWRKMLWKLALDHSSDARVAGKGLGSFRINSPVFFPLAPRTDAHSSYVLAIYETGVVGLVLLLLIPLTMVTVFLRAHRSSVVASGIGLSIISAWLIVSYSDNLHGYLTVNWYCWALLGCATAVALRSGQRASPSGAQHKPPSALKYG